MFEISAEKTHKRLDDKGIEIGKIYMTEGGSLVVVTEIIVFDETNEKWLVYYKYIKGVIGGRFSRDYRTFLKGFRELPQ